MGDFWWPRVGVSDRGSLHAVDRDPDLDLLEAWRDGDEKAGSRLLRQYLQPLRRFFVNKVAPDDLEDVIQQTMLGCVRGTERFRGEARFKTYLFNIARKALAYHHRGRRNKEDRTEELDLEVVSARELVPGPSSIVAKTRRHQLMLEALRAIPLDDQIVLELYYWEDMSAPEIAQAYDMGVPAVRGRLRRAKGAFEEALRELADGEDEFTSTLSAFEARSWVEEIRERLHELQPVRKKRRPS
jgi:RNA polymerase sigma-70 factor, ECF subfamily